LNLNVFTTGGCIFFVQMRNLQKKKILQSEVQFVEYAFAIGMLHAATTQLKKKKTSTKSIIIGMIYIFGNGCRVVTDRRMLSLFESVVQTFLFEMRKSLA